MDGGGAGADIDGVAVVDQHEIGRCGIVHQLHAQVRLRRRVVDADREVGGGVLRDPIAGGAGDEARLGAGREERAGVGGG